MAPTWAGLDLFAGPWRPHWRSHLVEVRERQEIPNTGYPSVEVFFSTRGPCRHMVDRQGRRILHDCGEAFRFRSRGVAFGWHCSRHGPRLPVRSAAKGRLGKRLTPCREGIAWSILVANGLHFVKVSVAGLPSTRNDGCSLNGRRLPQRYNIDRAWRKQRGAFDNAVEAIAFTRVITLTVGRRCAGPEKLMFLQMSSPGNPSCWTAGRSWHHCCAVGAGCFDTGADPTFEACCRQTFEFQAPTAGVVAAVQLRPSHLHPASLQAMDPKSQHSPNAGRGLLNLLNSPLWFHMTCSIMLRPRINAAGFFRCFGLASNFFNQKPELPPWPAPQRCPGGLDIFPIAIGIADELIVPCISVKSFDYALAWPGDRSTYTFNSQSRDDTAGYHEHLRQAWFAITRPKGGWDCLRHYEILAAGSLPYFVDLARAPSRQIPFLPIHLLRVAKTLPGVYEGRLDPTAFNIREYVEAAAALLRYTKHRLAASKLAEYLLSHLQMKRGSVLFLLPPKGFQRGGYVSRNMFYGLRKILGPASVVDYPHFAEMYAAHGRTDMSTTGLLDTPVVRWNSSQVEDRLRSRGFGAVIYSNARAPLPFWELVASLYAPEEVAFLDGFDHTNGSTILRLAPYGRQLAPSGTLGQ